MNDFELNDTFDNFTFTTADNVARYEGRVVKLQYSRETDITVDDSIFLSASRAFSGISDAGLNFQGSEISGESSEKTHNFHSKQFNPDASNHSSPRNNISADVNDLSDFSCDAVESRARREEHFNLKNDFSSNSITSDMSEKENEIEDTSSESIVSCMSDVEEENALINNKKNKGGNSNDVQLSNSNHINSQFGVNTNSFNIYPGRNSSRKEDSSKICESDALLSKLALKGVSNKSISKQKTGNGNEFLFGSYPEEIGAENDLFDDDVFLKSNSQQNEVRKFESSREGRRRDPERNLLDDDFSFNSNLDQIGKDESFDDDDSIKSKSERLNHANNSVQNDAIISFDSNKEGKRRDPEGNLLDDDFSFNTNSNHIGKDETLNDVASIKSKSRCMNQANNSEQNNSVMLFGSNKEGRRRDLERNLLDDDFSFNSDFEQIGKDDVASMKSRSEQVNQANNFEQNVAIVLFNSNKEERQSDPEGNLLDDDFSFKSNSELLIGKDETFASVKSKSARLNRANNSVDDTDLFESDLEEFKDGDCSLGSDFSFESNFEGLAKRDESRNDSSFKSNSEGVAKQDELRIDSSFKSNSKGVARRDESRNDSSFKLNSEGVDELSIASIKTEYLKSPEVDFSRSCASINSANSLNESNSDVLKKDESINDIVSVIREVENLSESRTSINTINSLNESNSEELSKKNESINNVASVIREIGNLSESINESNLNELSKNYATLNIPEVNNLSELCVSINTINSSNEDLNESLEAPVGLNEDLSSWGLPEVILRKYEDKKIERMFPWQVECLTKPGVLETHRNLVYSAPTSAGKTLVAEILAIKTVLERRKKVIFILPFVSVVREKMFYFKDILGTSGVRVEGYMGSYNPPGGFKKVNVAICTIEKANSLVNRLLEEGNLGEIGAVVVDEMHLLGDSSRGYLLELLLTKLRYMSLKDEGVNIQIIGMSATLPNLNTLADWLDAELFTTDFRPIPLHEQCIVEGEIYDNNFRLCRKLSKLPELQTDTDNVLQLCLETIESSCSVLIFCPSKNWCESLSLQISSAFFKIGSTPTEMGLKLRNQLNSQLIRECLEQLKRCPVGLDSVLAKTVSFGVAYHHAGLTIDERDIIEGAFKTGSVRVLIATSTLSSGVNLPARRVLIRSPMFNGKPLDTLTYRQMIGRAGRMGKDTEGESLLICQKNDHKIAKELMSANLRPVESCLVGAGKLKRAILEVITSDVASSPQEIELFTKCTLLASDPNRDNEISDPIEDSIKFLIENEFIRLQSDQSKYIATSLAKACLSSSLPPEEGLSLFTELEKARQCFVLETELHLIYLVTPYSACNQLGNIDWMVYLDLWEKLPASMKRVGELVGVRVAYIINGTRGKIQTNTSKLYHKLQIHKRFYTALALQDLVNEIPLNTVANKFGCNRGMLQALQQSASTFAGMVTSFSKQLGWSSVEILVSQFQDRLQFGISRELLDLMRTPLLNGQRARVLYNAGIESLIDLANTDVCTLENILRKAKPFETEKEREGESAYEADKRNKLRTVWVTGKRGLTEKEAAELLIQDARVYLQLELGLREAHWDDDSAPISKSTVTGNLKEEGGNRESVNSPEGSNSSNKKADGIKRSGNENKNEFVINSSNKKSDRSDNKNEFVFNSNRRYIEGNTSKLKFRDKSGNGNKNKSNINSKGINDKENVSALEFKEGNQNKNKINSNRKEAKGNISELQFRDNSENENKNKPNINSNEKVVKENTSAFELREEGGIINNKNENEMIYNNNIKNKDLKNGRGSGDKNNIENKNSRKGRESEDKNNMENKDLKNRREINIENKNSRKGKESEDNNTENKDLNNRREVNIENKNSRKGRESEDNNNTENRDLKNRREINIENKDLKKGRESGDGRVVVDGKGIKCNNLNRGERRTSSSSELVIDVKSEFRRTIDKNTNVEEGKGSGEKVMATRSKTRGINCGNLDLEKRRTISSSELTRDSELVVRKIGNVKGRNYVKVGETIEEVGNGKFSEVNVEDTNIEEGKAVVVKEARSRKRGMICDHLDLKKRRTVSSSELTFNIKSEARIGNINGGDYVKVGANTNEVENRMSEINVMKYRDGENSRNDRAIEAKVGEIGNRMLSEMNVMKHKHEENPENNRDNNAKMVSTGVNMVQTSNLIDTQSRKFTSLENQVRATTKTNRSIQKVASNSREETNFRSSSSVKGRGYMKIGEAENRMLFEINPIKEENERNPVNDREIKAKKMQLNYLDANKNKSPENLMIIRTRTEKKSVKKIVGVGIEEISDSKPSGTKTGSNLLGKRFSVVDSDSENKDAFIKRTTTAGGDVKKIIVDIPDLKSCGTNFLGKRFSLIDSASENEDPFNNTPKRRKSTNLDKTRMEQLDIKLHSPKQSVKCGVKQSDIIRANFQKLCKGNQNEFKEVRDDEGNQFNKRGFDINSMPSEKNTNDKKNCAKHISDSNSKDLLNKQTALSLSSKANSDSSTKQNVENKGTFRNNSSSNDSRKLNVVNEETIIKENKTEGVEKATLLKSERRIRNNKVKNTEEGKDGSKLRDFKNFENKGILRNNSINSNNPNAANEGYNPKAESNSSNQTVSKIAQNLSNEIIRVAGKKITSVDIEDEELEISTSSSFSLNISTEPHEVSISRKKADLSSQSLFEDSFGLDSRVMRNISNLEGGEKFLHFDKQTDEILINRNKQIKDTLIKSEEETKDTLIKSENETNEKLIIGEKQTKETLIKNEKQTKEILSKGGETTKQTLINSEKQTKETLVKNEKQTKETLINSDKQMKETLIKSEKETKNRLHEDIFTKITNNETSSNSSEFLSGNFNSAIMRNISDIESGLNPLINKDDCQLLFEEDGIIEEKEIFNKVDRQFLLKDGEATKEEENDVQIFEDRETINEKIVPNKPVFSEVKEVSNKKDNCTKNSNKKENFTEVSNKKNNSTEVSKKIDNFTEKEISLGDFGSQFETQFLVAAIENKNKPSKSNKNTISHIKTTNINIGGSNKNADSEEILCNDSLDFDSKILEDLSQIEKCNNKNMNHVKNNFEKIDFSEKNQMINKIFEERKCFTEMELSASKIDKNNKLVGRRDFFVEKESAETNNKQLRKKQKCVETDSSTKFDLENIQPVIESVKDVEIKASSHKNEAQLKSDNNLNKGRNYQKKSKISAINNSDENLISNEINTLKQFAGNSNKDFLTKNIKGSSNKNEAQLKSENNLNKEMNYNKISKISTINNSEENLTSRETNTLKQSAGFSNKQEQESSDDNFDLINNSSEDVSKSRKRPRCHPSETDCSPMKKPKLGKARTQRSNSLSIDKTYIISSEKSRTVCNQSSIKEEEESVDLSKFEIIDVCGDSRLFDCFKEELLRQKEIAVSLGCERVERVKTLIGIKKGNEKTERFIYKDVKLNGVAICLGGNTVYYIDLNESKVSTTDKAALLKSVFEEVDGLRVRIFDAKEQIGVLKHCAGIDFNCFCDDPKVADWLLDPEGREKNLRLLTSTYAPEGNKLCEMAGKTKGVGSLGLELNSAIDLKLRCSIESVLTWNLTNPLSNLLAAREEDLLHTYDIETNCLLILAKIEIAGFGVDLRELQKLADEINSYTNAVESKAFELAGRRFSFIRSTDVAKVLGIYKGKRINTNKKVLHKNDSPLSSLILLWRRLNSALTKMVHPLLRLVENQRIHGKHITHSATGRISMQEPNIQNMPRDFEFQHPLSGEPVVLMCRRAFCARDKNVLISADYCQLELRLLAHFSQDRVLCGIMRTDEDVFKLIAAKWNNISRNEVTDLIRRQTKQICYGIIYGMGNRTLADQLCVEEEEALEFTESFHGKYPGIRRFINATVAECRELGYVQTIGGRRRYLPHINDENPTVKSQAERQAVNTMIQGSAADIVKNVMTLIENKVKDKFKSSRNKPKMVLHLHDELIYEVPTKYLEVFAKLLKRCMQDTVKLSIPFPVKVKTGPNWSDLKDYSI